MARNSIYRVFATVFGLGYFPLMPGTWGSLGGVFACYLLKGLPAAYFAFFIVFFILGVICAGRVEEETGIKDPSMVVIDEFICVFPVFFYVPMTPATVITGFIIYRLIDIIKIPPMKKVEEMPGGWGIMLDDLIGGIYTNIILQVLVLTT